jgi:hypothetical protein
MKTYKCQLCYISDQAIYEVMDMDQFVRHMVDDHQSPKIKEMLETLERFGKIAEKEAK